MNDKRVKIYLDDHLALMVAEIELIARCHRSNQDTPLGEFLQQLETEVKIQKGATRDLLRRLGDKMRLESKVKQSAAWLAEKVGRLKLNDALFSYSALSRLIELETLVAAAQARVSLWDSFDVVASDEPEFEGVDFTSYREQSQQHLDELDVHRRAAAVQAFEKD